MDDVTVAMVGPFPELNDHNAIATSIPLPCTFVGIPPNARYWSIQVFLPPCNNSDGELVNGDQIKCDEEFKLDAFGRYTLTISGTAPEGSQKGGTYINSGDASRAKMVVIRAFCVPSGQAWTCPKVYKSLEDAEVEKDEIRFDNTERVPGPPSMALSDVYGKVGALHRLIGVGKINALLLFVLPMYTRQIVVSWIGAYCIRNHLLNKVALKMKGLLLGVRKLKFNLEVSRPAARASLGGSAKHSYYTMVYDARDEDVEVNGVLTKINETTGEKAFRYTSVTCYEFNSLPLPQYFDDRSITSNNTSKDKNQVNYTVRLTTKPTRRQGLNEIDVRGCPVGVAVVRLVYPSDENVLEDCKPSINVKPEKEVVEAEPAPILISL